MPDLIPYTFDAATPTRSQSRQLGRSLGTLGVRTRLDIARIESEAEVQAIRVDAITYVAKRGMQNAAMLSQLEQQLATMIPMASGRLAAIGDMAALAIAEVVMDTGRRVR